MAKFSNKMDFLKQREDESLRKIDELQESIKAHEISFNNLLMQLRSLSKLIRDEEKKQEIIILLHNIEAISASPSFAILKGKLEERLRELEEAKERSQSLKKTNEITLQEEMGALFAPFLGIGKSKDTRYLATGTLSPFIYLPDESKPFLERVTSFEGQLRELVNDFDRNYRDLITRHSTADTMVSITESEKVEKTVNLLKMTKDILRKKQASTMARSERDTIRKQLHDMGFTLEKQNMYIAANKALKKLEQIKTQLIDNDKYDIIRPAVLSSIIVAATDYNDHLASREPLLEDTRSRLDDLIGADQQVMTTENFLSLGAKSVRTSPSTSDSSPYRSYASSVTDKGSSIEDRESEVKNFSIRSVFLASHIHEAMYEAVNKYFEDIGKTFDGHFEEGKPIINFKEFIEDYFPSSEYGEIYKSNFAKALEQSYERIGVGALIEIMKKEKVKSIASEFGEDFSAASDIEFDSVDDLSALRTPDSSPGAAGAGGPAVRKSL